MYREALSDKGKHRDRGATNAGTFFGEMTPSAPLRRSDRDASGTSARSRSFEGSDGVVRHPLRRSGHPLRRSTASGPRDLLPSLRRPARNPADPTVGATRPRTDHTRSFRENTRQHPDFTPINPPLRPREEISGRNSGTRGETDPALLRRRPLDGDPSRIRAAIKCSALTPPSTRQAREQRRCRKNAPLRRHGESPPRNEAKSPRGTPRTIP